MNSYKSPGDVRTITAAAAISSDDVVVVGTQLGIATTDIANGAQGEVAFSGVFEVAKVSTAVIADGEAVIWDASASAFEDAAHTPAAGDVSGAAVAVGAFGNGTTTMLVHLNSRIGTVA